MRDEQIDGYSNTILHPTTETDEHEMFEFTIPCTVVRNRTTGVLTLLMTNDIGDMYEAPPDNTAETVLSWLGYELRSGE